MLNGKVNFKKGFIRFLLVSSIAIFIWGYLDGSDKANDIYINQRSSMEDAVAELKKVECRNIANKLPDVWPTNTTSLLNDPCISLYFRYDAIKTLHDAKGLIGPITEQDIRAEWVENYGNYRIRHGLIGAALNLLLFWFLLISLFAIFFILRWVFRGFKN